MNCPPSLPKARRSRVWLWVLLAVLLSPAVAGLSLVLLLLGLSACFVSGASFTAGAGVDEKPALREIWSWGDGEEKVARIPVRGVLMEEESDGLFSRRGVVDTVLRQIRTATTDGSIRAIILEIDSPGGSITASDLIYNALCDFKADGRPVVAILGDLAASGGYYVASAADFILAHPTTLTGSFSVILTKLDVKDLGDRYGVKVETIKSGENKDMLNPFAHMSEEQRALLQTVINEMHERFVSLILARRPGLSEDRIRALADGRLLSSTQALECGVVDEIGYWERAVEKAAELIDSEKTKVIRYEEAFSLSTLLKSLGPAGMSAVGLAETARPRILALWF